MLPDFSAQVRVVEQDVVLVVQLAIQLEAAAIQAGKTVAAPPLTSVPLRFVKGGMTVSQSQRRFSELTPGEGEILELMAQGSGEKIDRVQPRYLRWHG